MKKRDMQEAVRRVHPCATAHAFPNGTWEILPDGVLLEGYQPLNKAPYAYSEYTAWASALRALGTAPMRK